jgi:hypothetical protein
MKSSRRYLPEHFLLLAAIALTITGFWKIYFGPGADPTQFHHAHVLTTSVWLLLLLYQLKLVRENRYQDHRKVGLTVLVFAPLLVSTAALLSVHSAQKGLASGQGDFLIVQNVGVTLELALLIILAFVWRRRRNLHGALLLSTALLFIGIALFFTLTSVVPGFRIEGPETFSRFAIAAATSQGICLAIGLLFFFKDWRNGWPMFMAGAFFLVNELINQLLKAGSLLAPLTEFVGSLSPTFTFLGTFASFLALLVATGILPKQRSKPTPLRGAA